MNDRGEGSILGRLAYSIGYAMGRADTLIEVDDAPAADPTVVQPPYTGGHQNDRTTAPGKDYTRQEHWPAPEERGPSAGIALGTLAAGWLLSRLIRPRPVNWPRAVLAGVAGTALAELADSLSHRDAERPIPFPPRAEDLPRYAAGVATAAAYGAQIYPRLPGSPLTRGLIFGTVEAMVADSGGALGLLQRVAPQLRLPLGSLAEYASERGPAASLAFGLGLGLYSAKGKRR